MKINNQEFINAFAMAMLFDDEEFELENLIEKYELTASRDELEFIESFIKGQYAKIEIEILPRLNKKYDDEPKEENLYYFRWKSALNYELKKAKNYWENTDRITEFFRNNESEFDPSFLCDFWVEIKFAILNVTPGSKEKFDDYYKQFSENISRLEGETDAHFIDGIPQRKFRSIWENYSSLMNKEILSDGKGRVIVGQTNAQKLEEVLVKFYEIQITMLLEGKIAAFMYARQETGRFASLLFSHIKSGRILVHLAKTQFRANQIENLSKAFEKEENQFLDFRTELKDRILESVEQISDSTRKTKNMIEVLKYFGKYFSEEQALNYFERLKNITNINVLEAFGSIAGKIPFDEEFYLGLIEKQAPSRRESSAFLFYSEPWKHLSDEKLIDLFKALYELFPEFFDKHIMVKQTMKSKPHLKESLIQIAKENLDEFGYIEFLIITDMREMVTDKNLYKIFAEKFKSQNKQNEHEVAIGIGNHRTLSLLSGYLTIDKTVSAEDISRDIIPILKAILENPKQFYSEKALIISEILKILMNRNDLAYAFREIIEVNEEIIEEYLKCPDIVDSDIEEFRLLAIGCVLFMYPESLSDKVIIEHMDNTNGRLRALLGRIIDALLFTELGVKKEVRNNLALVSVSMLNDDDEASRANAVTALSHCYDLDEMMKRTVIKMILEKFKRECYKVRYTILNHYDDYCKNYGEGFKEVGYEILEITKNEPDWRLQRVAGQIEEAFEEYFNSEDNDV